MRIEKEELTLPGPEPDGGLSLAFIRLRPCTPAAIPPQARRLSLVFLHSVASHKEAWIPTIDHLFELQHSTPTDAFSVVEAWAMDAPSHGRAAVLNDSRLHDFPNGITGEQWARATGVLLASGLLAGDSIVGIGHSAGACVLIQSTATHAHGRNPYASLVLVEPTMMTPEILQRAFAQDTVLLRAVDIARTRKDTWPSRPAAREWLARRLPWRRWDARVLDLFVENALCDLPTATYPGEKEGVTLACTRVQEVAGYTHHEDGFAALEMLKTLCPAMPVHTVFGGKRDMVPAETQESITSVAEGRKMRSIARVEGAGHLVVQESPRGLALAIWGILHEDNARPLGTPARPRL
ncbi:alpha/beta-hydrolase [Trametes elegans]|nr:alpha/beta-hydrolase [Trametes elegans]